MEREYNKPKPTIGRPKHEHLHHFRGDTLWAIARRFGCSVQALAACNHLRDPNLIFPGQVLRLPACAFCCSIC